LYDILRSRLSKLTLRHFGKNYLQLFIDKVNIYYASLCLQKFLFYFGMFSVFLPA